MSYYFEYDPSRGILRCRIGGKLTDEMLKECYRLGSEIVLKASPKAGILDLSDVTSLKVSHMTILELACLPPIIQNPDLTRVIIAEPLHIFGLARTFALVGQHTRPNLHVVRQEKQALAIPGVRNLHFKIYEE